MYSLIFKYLFLLLILTNTFAFKNDFSLKTGFIISESAFNKIDQDDEEYNEDEDSSSLGVYTSFAYSWERIESGLESRLTLGKEAKLSFSSQGEQTRGKGSIMTVDISPFAKLHSKTFNIHDKISSFFETVNFSPLYVYFRVGPSWQIQTINLDKFDLNYNDIDGENLKLSYESIGFSFSIGIEEDLSSKSQHPCFLEINISAYESYKLSLIDRTDRKEINILTQREAKQDIKTYQLMFIFGFTLF